MADLPKGFTCECGMEHKFSLYVFAHWREVLDHTCESCGRQHSIILGRAELTKGPSSAPNATREKA